MRGKKKQNVAIIISDTLRRMGLESILDILTEPLRVDSFETFELFVSSQGDLYDVVFVEADSFALNSDYFIGKRTKVVPIIEYGNPDTLQHFEKEVPYIHTKWSRSLLLQKLKDTLAENRKVQRETEDKGLSSREEEVLREVAKGMTNKEIADRLNISMNTVMSHRKNITAKLSIKTVSGLTFYALMNGLITGEDVVDSPVEQMQ